MRFTAEYGVNLITLYSEVSSNIFFLAIKCLSCGNIFFSWHYLTGTSYKIMQ